MAHPYCPHTWDMAVMTMCCRGAESEAFLGLHPPLTTDSHRKSKCLTVVQISSSAQGAKFPDKAERWLRVVCSNARMSQLLHGGLGNPKTVSSQPTSPVPCASADHHESLQKTRACMERPEDTKALDLSWEEGSAVHSLACTFMIINQPSVNN